MLQRRGIAALYLAALAAATVAARSPSPSRTAQASDKAVGTFEIDNNQTGVLRKGVSHVGTVDAYAVHEAHMRPYPNEGLLIFYFAKPLTDTDRADILTKDARKSGNGDYAVMQLWFDKERKVSQANLSVIVPGTTVVRTVAYLQADLKRDFGNVEFDGKRIKVDSRGLFKERNDKQEELSLSWQVQLDIPVAERPAK
jgi:hypothetical protein